MRGVDAIRQALRSTQNLLTWFLSDLSDEELVVRPVPGANHIAWQMGHLILSEAMMVKEQLPTAAYPDLPAGFAEKHVKETQGKESSADFCTKAEYIDAFTKTRLATIAVVEGLSDADLDRPTQGNMARIAPTLGALLLLVSNHSLMHGGQFSVVRRKLGKPVLL
jgi:uncharacterized damage-inducible protein DinB